MWRFRVFDRAVTDQRERLLQFKTNIDVVMSLLDRNGLGDWLADRLVAIAETLQDDLPLRIQTQRDPSRMRACAWPISRLSRNVTRASSGLWRGEARRYCPVPQAGDVAGTRRAIAEILKWMNYVTDNRFITLAADLSESINVEHGHLWGHYDPETNPIGTRFKAAIEEAGNASSAIGLVGQSAALDPQQFAGVWALAVPTAPSPPHVPCQLASGQQNQDSRFRMGVLHILAGHSGPETAADARTHFGIFAPQVLSSFRVARRCISTSGIITTLPQAILPQQRSRPESQGGHYYPGSGPARFSGRPQHVC